MVLLEEDADTVSVVVVGTDNGREFIVVAVMAVGGLATTMALESVTDTVLESVMVPTLVVGGVQTTVAVESEIEHVVLVVVLVVDSSIFVFRISGSVRRRRFAGFHPRSLIAFLLVITLPNDECQTIFTSGKISPLLKSALIPILTRNKTNNPFSLYNSTL